MQSDPYSREMVDEKLKAILEAIHEVKAIAIETRDHASKTNGRVTKLEATCITDDDLDDVKSFMSSTKTVQAIIGSIIIAIVLPVFAYFAVQEEQLNVQVQAHISTMK